MSITLLLLTVSLAASAPGQADSWPAYRGPHGDGRSDATGLPLHWSETRNVRWKTELPGKAWSSPVVWGEQVWVTNAPADGKQLFAICLDRRSGKILHNVTVFNVAKPAFCHPLNSYASPTPVITEGRLFVHYGSAGTACLDTASGKVLWSRNDLPCDHFRGPASSPILYEGLLIIPFDGFDFQYVVALDSKTGRTVWKKDRDVAWKSNNGDSKKAYATPGLVQTGGRTQLICQGAMATLAYDPRTGKELWKVYHGGMNAATRPPFAKGMVFLNTGDGGDGLLAVRVDGDGDVTKSHVAWKRKKGVPNRSSLLLAGDRLFMVTQNGVVSCVGVSDGKTLWEGRLQGEFFASPVYADGRLYFFDRGGRGYVVAAGPAWKVLATNKLADGCMASPAIAGKSLFVRTRTHLYCLERLPEGASNR